MDCIAGMRHHLPAASVDAVITDPPFGIGFGGARHNYGRNNSYHGAPENILRGYKEVDLEEYAQFSRDWMSEVFRVMKPGATAMVFSGWTNLRDILNAAHDVGFETFNHVIWRYQFGVFCRRRFVSSHYHCLCLCKDDAKRKFNRESRFPDASREDGKNPQYNDMEDVWVINREYWKKDMVKTPTKLPRELVEKCLAYATDPGDLVLDPFLGSGQVAVVSAMNGRRYAGFEAVEDYFRLIRCRLDSGKYLVTQEDLKLYNQPTTKEI